MSLLWRYREAEYECARLKGLEGWIAAAEVDPGTGKSTMLMPREHWARRVTEIAAERIASSELPAAD